MLKALASLIECIRIYLEIKKSKLVLDVLNEEYENEQEFQEKITTLRADGQHALVDRLQRDRSRLASLRSHIIAGLPLSGKWSELYEQNGTTDNTSIGKNNTGEGRDNK